MTSLSVVSVDAVEDYLQAVGKDPATRSLGSVGSRDRYTRFLRKHIAFRISENIDVERKVLLVVMVKDAPETEYVSRHKVLPFVRP
jgi:hypothetical protein